MSQPLTPTERLLALADRYSLSAEEQLAMLGSIDLYAHDPHAPNNLVSLPRFQRSLDAIDAELAALVAAASTPVAPSPQPPKEPDLPTVATMANDGVAELGTFFDRNLARHSLVKLVQLPIDGAVFERVGYDTARLVVPKSEMATYKDILGRGLNFEAADGEIIAGWYTIFADGSTAAVAIVNAKQADGGAYVDAFLILPDGVHPTVPNVSLPPRQRLDEDFVFSYPDGTYKVIRLVPSTV